MKAGLFVERTIRPAARSSSFNSTLSFNTSSLNSGNTNIGFANVLLGSVRQYTESNAHPTGHGEFVNTDWYVQDTWRIKPRLTIDAGVRFYYISPTHSQGDQVAMFVPSNYGSVTQREFTGYSDYRALQVWMNRWRAANGLSFSLSYTLSKSMSLGAIDPFASDNRARNYTAAGSRPRSLVINYSYEVPNLSRKWNNVVARTLFDNWQMSGVTSAISGTKGSITYSFTGVPTGALVGTGTTVNTGAIGEATSRVTLVCDPNLPASQRTFNRQFRTECVQPASDPFRLGSARGDELQGPGYVNFDFSLFKSVPPGGNRRLQLRVELYNAFNTDQFSALNTAAVFDYLTGAQTNAAFGSLTGATRAACRISSARGLRFNDEEESEWHLSRESGSCVCLVCGARLVRNGERGSGASHARRHTCGDRGRRERGGDPRRLRRADQHRHSTHEAH